jgi:hypothetical protein
MLRGASVSYRFSELRLGVETEAKPDPTLTRIEQWERLLALDHFGQWLDVKAAEITTKYEAEDEEEITVVT